MIETAWLDEPVAKLHDAALKAAEARQADLTKPLGALGKVEEIAVRLSAMQDTEHPSVDQVYIVVFVGDHGVVAEGISAFPQAVTGEMLKNFVGGGAAISVLAQELKAKLEVFNMGIVNNTDCPDAVVSINLGPGTANIREAPAMQEDQLRVALDTGQQAAEKAKLDDAHLFIGGEMGIGNTTSTAALACALLNSPAERIVGPPGTGLDAQGLERKRKTISRALHLHRQYLESPLEALRRLGGFEIAALVGSYLRCAQIGLPVLIDGFISSVAALTVIRLCSDAGDWFLYSHRSADPGHAVVLNALGAQPLFDLSMRLGEGSGAAITVPLLRMACALHNKMATFSEAGISKQNTGS